MKRSILTLAVLTALSQLAYSGTAPYSGKDMKQVAPPPCPEWYGDNEWNINLWGTYAFTGTEYAPNLDLVDLIQSTTEGQTVLGTFDKYLGGDHAWGGGMDIKYFFHRYFGVGVEGFVLNAHRGAGFDLESNGLDVFIHEKRSENRAVGEVLGTFTLRYPIPCSRFSPYVWAGGGIIWGGGERDEIIFDGFGGDFAPVPLYHTVHHGTTSEAVGQFGGGLEFRVTPHIGWMNDFSWNVINGPQNNFGMVRSGLTFAF
jgi:hypothetical protein